MKANATNTLPIPSQGKHNASIEFTPTRQQKLSESKTSNKSTALKTDEKKNLKLELEQASREVKKKLVYDGPMGDVLLKKVLAFIISACRRDK
jgi:hypothetical protein